MKVQDHEDEDTDLAPTHFKCWDDNAVFSNEDFGYDAEENPSLDGVECPEDAGHAVSWLHISDTPVASPNAKRDGEDGWLMETLEDIDADHYHFGNKRFEFDLEEE